MSARIGNSYIDNVIYRHWNNVSGRVSKRIERLSSGLRINSAADDASGIGISEKLRALASGIQVSIGNLQDGISMIQTAQGSLDRVSQMVKRIRDLSQLAANGDKTSEDREYYQAEIDQLLNEIDRLGNTSQYNTKKLLNGELGTEVRLAGDKDGVVSEINYNGKSPLKTGEYKFEVLETATKASALITGKGRDSDSGDVAFTLDDKFVDFVGGTSGKYSFNIETQGKNVQIEIDANGTTTIGDAINEINKVFANNGIKLTAYFEGDVNDTTAGVVGDNDILGAIKIESTQYGSSGDIKVSVINQPGGVFSVEPTASEGSEFKIYNSDLSFDNGSISIDTVIQSGDNADDINSLELLSDYENANGEVVLNNAITIQDGAGNIKTIDIDTTGNNKVSIKNIIDAINSKTDGATFGGLTVHLSGSDFNAEASYDNTGKINLIDNSAVKTKALKVDGVLAERLGIKGESNFSHQIAGQKLTSTKDYKLEVTSPDGNKIEILTKYFGGGNDIKFTADSFSSTGYETSDGEMKGGIPGLELKLNNKKLSGGEKFSLIVNSGDVNLVAHPDGSVYDFSIPQFTSESLGLKGLNVTTQKNAMKVLDDGIIDKALDKVVTIETRLGGISSGIEHEISRLRIEYENITSGESRLRDTDVGYEMMQLAKEQIIQQSGSKMLSFEKLDRSIVKALLQAL